MQLTVVADRWGGYGGELYLWELVYAIIQAGHSVQVYCQQNHADSEANFVHALPLPPFPRFVRDRSFCRKVIRELQNSPRHSILAVRPINVATHYQLPAGLYAAAFESERESLNSLLRRWLYWPANSINPKRRLLMQMQEKLLMGRNRPRLMANSNLVRTQLQNFYGIASDVVTLHPGINLDRFHPGEKSTKAHVPPTGGEELSLLFVAHNFVLKGLHCLLAALARARRSGLKARLLVAGEGPIYEFRKLARRLGIASQVSFLGAVGQDTLAGLYRSSDTLVHPTFYDPCSSVVLEALACGCPVITTRRNGAAELMESGKHGLVLDDPRDTEALAEALLALQDRPELEHMSYAAALLGRSFDLKTHTAKVVAWLGLPQS
ncbi:MAG TPA: glycosyltransferase family 4 protein [Acidobacteriota bacterium]|nr:glycosyltransferase family 4 protein [Acidobacteriota bacterium]